MTLTVLMIALVQSTYKDDHISLTGFLDSLLQEFFLRAHLIETAAYGDTIVTLYGVAHIATSIIDLGIGETRTDTVEGKNLLLHLQRGGTATYGHHLDGIFTDHQNLLLSCRINRQHRSLNSPPFGGVGGGFILQQHDTLLSNLQCCLIMALRTEEAKGLLTVHRRTIEQSEHAAHLVVEFLRRVLTLLDQLLVGIGHKVEIIGIGLAHRQSVGPRTELQVESVLDGLFGVVTATPVGDDHTIVLPITLQDLVEHNIIVTIVLVLIEVVGAHDTPCATLSDGSLEGRQVDLMESTV